MFSFPQLLIQMKGLRGTSHAGNVQLGFSDGDDMLVLLALSLQKIPQDNIERMLEAFSRRQTKLKLLLRIDPNLFGNVPRKFCFFNVAYKLLLGTLPTFQEVQNFMVANYQEFDTDQDQILISTDQAFNLAVNRFDASLFCNTPNHLDIGGNVYGELTSTTVFIPPSIGNRDRYTIEQLQMVLFHPEAFYVLHNGHYYFGIPPMPAAAWITELNEALEDLLIKVIGILSN